MPDPSSLPPLKDTSSTPNNAPPPRRRFVGKAGPPSAASSKQPPLRPNQIPPSILENKLLKAAISELLPSNYNFELPKTIHQVTYHKVKTLGLQMPEGLLQWSLVIADLIRKFCPDCQDVVVLGDVTYGACCVDDFTAKSLGCEMLVHYGHSCLIPVDQTSIKTLYVFVEIGIDRQHLAETVRANFPVCIPSGLSTPFQSALSAPKHISIGAEGESSTKEEPVNLAVVGTVQFVSAVQGLKHDLENPASSARLAIAASDESSSQPDTTGPCSRFQITVPQIKPLSPGEILGCTAPKLSPDTHAILYVGDGRFHLESIMIANPTIPAFRYDPYEKRITHEGYDHVQMKQLRAKAIARASETLEPQDESARSQKKDWAIVLGTLGRQGSLSVLNRTKDLSGFEPAACAQSISTGLQRRSQDAKVPVPILLSELSPQKLKLFETDVEIFVQTSCPRLSIDWGESFPIPLLNPYEAKVSLGQATGFRTSSSINDGLLANYPMDFYADDSLGDWTPRFGKGRRKPVGLAKTVV